MRYTVYFEVEFSTAPFQFLIFPSQFGSLFFLPFYGLDPLFEVLKFFALLLEMVKHFVAFIREQLHGPLNIPDHVFQRHEAIIFLVYVIQDARNIHLMPLSAGKIIAGLQCSARLASPVHLLRFSLQPVRG